MILLDRIRVTVRLGKAFSDLGFRIAFHACESCGRSRRLERESTGEYWCAKCCYGRLYAGTKRREEVAWFFGDGGSALPLNREREDASASGKGGRPGVGPSDSQPTA